MLVLRLSFLQVAVICMLLEESNFIYKKENYNGLSWTPLKLHSSSIDFNIILDILILFKYITVTSLSLIGH